MEGLRVLGKPEYFAQFYYEHDADELIYQDTVASLYNRNNLTDIVEQTAKNIFIPLTVGGGIRSLDDINIVLRAGADKVSINTAAIKNPDFINEASKAFGSSTIVVAVEAIKEPNGNYLAYTDNGREYTGVEVSSWIKEVEDRGAGEILLTSIDNEGTGNGYDLDLIKMVSDIITIPLIAHGGAANINDISNAIRLANADAVSIASMLHYAAINRDYESSNLYLNEGNIEFLQRNSSFKTFGNQNIREIKRGLLEQDIPIRILS